MDLGTLIDTGRLLLPSNGIVAEERRRKRRERDTLFNWKVGQRALNVYSEA